MIGHDDRRAARARTTTMALAVGALGAALGLAAPGVAWAQAAGSTPAPDMSIGGFKLPPGPTSTPRAAGPTDANGAAPVPIDRIPQAINTLPASRTSATTVPTPRVPSRPAVQSTPAAPPGAAPTRSRPRAAAPVPTRSAPLPVPSPSASAAAPLVIPSAAPSLAVPPASDLAPSGTPVAPPQAALPEPAPAPANGWSAGWLVVVALLAAALGAVAAVLFLRSRQREAEVRAPAFVPPTLPVQPAAAEPAVSETRAAAVAAPPVSAPQIPEAIPEAIPAVPLASPAPAPVAAGPLTLTLEPVRMTSSLVTATLAYRLAVTNTGSEPVSGVTIAGDMISAHASRPTEEQLGTMSALAVLHQLPALGPGESATLKGDLRLPLTEITPIRRGEAQLFVPLARFAAEGRTDGGRAVEHREAFLVGQAPTADAPRLQPFRLDLGPRLYSAIGQRPLGIPA